jgi:hypothetical protein
MSEKSEEYKGNSNSSVPVSDCSNTTPRYTVINCFGKERKAAIQNTIIPIPDE